MCGIVYSKSLVGKPVSKTIIKRYTRQRSRGTDGFGFYVPETNRLTHNTKEGRILALLRRQKKAKEILMHHRMPTSTMNVRNACHPFSTKDYFEHNYVGVHNGVLWNENELKPEHYNRGIQYVSMQDDGSFNDSEALVYDLARYLEGEVDHITAEGSIAFILIQRSKQGEPIAVYFGRNTGNPLMMKLTDKSLTLSSEGDGILIDPNTMYCFNYKTGVLTRSPCRFPSYTSYNTGYAKTGYWWNNHYYESDDDELEELNRWNDSFNGTPTSEDTRRYFENEDHEQARRQYIAMECRRLVSENNDELQSAIDAGYGEIADLEKIEKDMHNIVNVSMTADEDEIEKYYRIGDRLYYLRQAVGELEKEVASGRPQMGFHYTPDSHGWNPHAERREAIDPTTGYAYYPYA